MTQQDSYEQFAIFKRLTHFKEKGWDFRPVGNRWNIFYPAKVREELGVNENACIHVSSSSLDAMLSAMEAAEEVYLLIRSKNEAVS